MRSKTLVGDLSNAWHMVSRPADKLSPASEPQSVVRMTWASAWYSSIHMKGGA